MLPPAPRFAAVSSSYDDISSSAGRVIAIGRASVPSPSPGQNWPLAINPKGAGEVREGIYRKVVNVISVILSRPLGYSSLLLAESASDSALIPLDVDGVLLLPARFPPGPLSARARRREIRQKRTRL